jgi:integrase
VFLQPDEIESLLKAADGNERDGTILALAAYSGLRCGEIFAAKWRDLDWTNAHSAPNKARRWTGTTGASATCRPS